MDMKEIMHAQTDDGRHHLLDGVLYSLPTGSPPANFPYVPPSNAYREPSALATSCFEVTTPAWITDETPYLGFVPAINPLYATWLRPLRYNFRTLPVQRRDDGKFDLRHEVQKEWDTLERNLRSLLSVAMSECSLALPHPFRLWSSPCQYGYTRAHKSENIARRKALASKDAFMPLMAALSFFAHALVYQKPTLYTTKSVISQLAKKCEISQAWSSFVENSLLDAPLTGGYVDCTSNSTTRWVPMLQSSRMPLCLSWGLSTKFVPSFVPSKLSRMHPSDENVVYLRTHQAPYKPPTSQPHVPSDRYEGPTASTAEMEKFFEKRADLNKKLEQSESTQARQSRLQRIEHSQKDLPPGGSSKTQVFLWELHGGTRVRKAGIKRLYEDYWTADYRPKQRRYDSFHDEWDMCTEFDPTDVPRDFDDFSEDEPADSYPDENPPITAGYTAGDYLGRLHGSTSPSTMTHNPAHFDLSLRELAHRRFGFAPPKSYTPRGVTSSDIKFARQVFSVIKAPIEPGMNESESKSLLEILDRITFAAAELKHLPPTLDLCQPDDAIHKPWPFEKVIYRQIEGGLWLVYCSEQTDRLSHIRRFYVGFNNATDLLEIARRGIGNKKEDIMEALIEQGSPFRTIIEHDTQGDMTGDTMTEPSPYIVPAPAVRNIVRMGDGASTPSGCRARLGFRPHGYKFILEDFRAYVAIRDEFLSSPRGRAAVLAGGLLARLAKDVVNKTDVLSGPSRDFLTAWMYGEQFSDPQEQTYIYWDDRLTEEEVNLICGVYEVATGPILPNGTYQTAELSWFPKPGAWKVSGLNCGYWSRDAELWYQKRLAQIEQGDAQLFNLVKWKENIKYSKKARHLNESYDKLTLEYLSNRFYPGDTA
ncbi:hypothetical protein V5O48_012311 [Marasmius crinis-equi]|uniref:Uncharacterized protein n=1 Tax=Marasmius crinis-equi TaxID=585013 RepID=A0ABR3F356_9AGAR